MKISFGNLLFFLAVMGHIQLFLSVPGVECSESSASGQHEYSKKFNLAENYSALLEKNLESSDSRDLSQKKHFWRAFIETSVCLGLFQIRYKKTHTTWVEGVHKYKATWKDQSEKFSSWKNFNYDANCFDLNWQHSLAGSAYYNFSRTNNLSVLESLLMSWASSSYWEFVVEYRSDVSINDHIFTPLGGLPVGEAWFQLGKFFADRTDTLSQILSYLNPILKMNRIFNRRNAKSLSPESIPGWHAFNIDLGVRNIRTQKGHFDQTAPYAGLHTEIMSLSEYGNQGKENNFIKEPLYSEIQFNLTGIGRTFEEMDLFTRVVWFGLFKQNINSLNRGYSFYLGGGSAFSMLKKKPGMTNLPCSYKGRNPAELKLDEPRDFTDKLSAVHIIGPVFDWKRYAKELNIRLVQDMYVDFGIVHSFAFNNYSSLYDYSSVKTPLLVNGYYYGWGITLSSRLDISWQDASFQSDLRYQSYGSIDGKDRFQHLVTDDFHLTDSRFLVRFSIGYRIPGLPLSLKASYESIHRRGRIKDIEEKDWETKGFIGISLLY